MRRSAILAVALLCLASTVSLAQLTDYSQDFEPPFDPSPSYPAAGSLAADGWRAFVNVFDSGGGFLYPYAPTLTQGGPQFAGVPVGEGDVPQGDQQMTVYNDYDNGDHILCTGGALPPDSDPNDPDCRIIEVNVFQEQVIGAADAGKTCTFAWQHKKGNIEGNSTAAAFIKVLDSNAGFGLSPGNSFPTVNTTNLPVAWDGDQIVVSIDPLWLPGGTGPNGHILQFGYLNTATNYEGSANFYDNVDFSCEFPQSVPTTGKTALFIFLALIATMMAVLVGRTATRRATV